MYPTLYDFLLDIFGDSIEFLSFLKVVNSFGFFVAISFIISSWILGKELRRKEREGKLSSFKMKEILGEKMKPTQLIASGAMGFLFGYKLLGVVFAIYTEDKLNTQEYLLSGQGNFLAGLAVAAFMIYSKYKEAKKAELSEPKEVTREMHPYQLVGNITMIAAIAGLIGAKIFHHLENFDDFLKNPSQILDPFSGLTYYGGLILGSVSVLYFLKKKGLKLVHVLDAAGPTLIAAYGMGRMGCQVSGDGDWGISNLAPKPDWLSWAPDWVWAYDYPNNVIGAEPGLVFPTPFYEILMMGFVFVILWNFRKKITVPGVMFGFYLVFNGLERFLIEKIRVNTHVWGTITQAEIISSILMLAGIVMIVVMFKRNKAKQEQLPI
jgi:prolipoprotein diacylglyceryl transferase